MKNWSLFLAIIVILVACHVQKKQSLQKIETNKVLFGIPDSLKVRMLKDIEKTKKEGYSFYVQLEMETFGNVDWRLAYTLKQRNNMDTLIHEYIFVSQTNNGIMLGQLFVPIYRREDIELYQLGLYVAGNKKAYQYFPGAGWGKTIARYYLNPEDYERMYRHE